MKLSTEDIEAYMQKWKAGISEIRGVATTESVHAKIFIEFVALIVRSWFYTCLKEQMQKNGKKNYMTVPAAIRELEKIELIRQSDRGYRMDYAVTAAQKEILKAFDYSERSFEKVMRFLSGREVDDE